MPLAPPSPPPRHNYNYLTTKVSVTYRLMASLSLGDYGESVLLCQNSRFCEPQKFFMCTKL